MLFCLCELSSGWTSVDIFPVDYSSVDFYSVNLYPVDFGPFQVIHTRNSGTLPNKIFANISSKMKIDIGEVGYLLADNKVMENFENF